MTMTLLCSAAISPARIFCLNKYPACDIPAVWPLLSIRMPLTAVAAIGWHNGVGPPARATGRACKAPFGQKHTFNPASPLQVHPPPYLTPLSACTGRQSCNSRATTWCRCHSTSSNGRRTSRAKRSARPLLRQMRQVSQGACRSS